jgi:hypothetical protein
MFDNKHNTNLLREFGIQCSQSIEMAVCEARVLNSPEIYYKGFKKPVVTNGQWRMSNRMENFNLFQTNRLNNWSILWIASEPSSNSEKNSIIFRKLMEGMRMVFTEGGLLMNKPHMEIMPNKNIVKIYEEIRQTRPETELIVFIIDKDDHYTNVKTLGERQYGYFTQCLKYSKLCSNMDLNIAPENLKDDRKLFAYLSNVLLKVNAKHGGINNQVNFDAVKKYAFRSIVLAENKSSCVYAQLYYASSF